MGMSTERRHEIIATLKALINPHRDGLMMPNGVALEIIDELESKGDPLAESAPKPYVLVQGANLKEKLAKGRDAGDD